VVVSQVYVPDPASVGQHVHDAARELARRGFRVVVYASARGYDDPSRRYPRREVLDGVRVRRVPFSSFGKGSLAARLAGGLVFLAQATLSALFTRRLGGVLVSTSPPMASLAGWTVARLRRAPLAFWVMDVNPDQAVASGGVRAGSLPARLLEASNRAAARASRAVIVLDRFMAARVVPRWGVEATAAVLPPWPLDDHLAPVPHAENPFRRRHGLDDSFVVMYSGNLSPVHPVTTVLDAARALAGDPRFRFVFVGGGGARAAVEEAVAGGGLENVLLLPYQPLSELRYSLSAADLHLVTLGNAMVGIVHPCKVYGALRVARPVLFVGPAESHVGEILRASGAGWQVPHGDAEGAAARIREAAALSPERRAAIGAAGAAWLETEASKELLCGRLSDLLERIATGRGGAVTSRAAP